MQFIVTDIEGTTSSIAFVKNVLFPYSRKHLPTFVRSHQDDPIVMKLMDDTRAVADAHGSSVSAVIELLLQWIDEDRKTTPLKQLQGLIWAEGYAQNVFRGHVYPDAARSLRRWAASSKQLYVYSSGSVEAQRLLFTHSEAGDLSGLFVGYFDTRIGAKQARESYTAIAVALNADPPTVLFLSDTPAELFAAREAGMRVIQLCRDSTTIPAVPWDAVHSFDDISV